jgi:hypothetical protein
MSEGLIENPADPTDQTSDPQLRWGWRPPSKRLLARMAKLQDHDFAIPFTLQPSADLRPGMPPIYDQLDAATCCGNAVGALVQYLWMKKGINPNDASRLFLYWNARVIDHSTSVDQGTSIAATTLGAYQHGCCREGYWSYVQPHILQPPAAQAIADAGQLRFAAPIQVIGLDAIRAHIAGGQPVAFGINIQSSFFQGDAHKGVVPVPDPNAPGRPHAALLVGFDNASQLFIMRSSWGVQRPNGMPYGDGGYYYIPYAYLDPRFTSDFWTLTSV